MHQQLQSQSQSKQQQPPDLCPPPPFAAAIMASPSVAASSSPQDAAAAAVISRAIPEVDEEDLETELDLDSMISECTHLTSPATISVACSRPKSSSPSYHHHHRSPSRTLMLAIGGMLSSSSSTTTKKSPSPGSPEESRSISGQAEAGQCTASDEIQILIESTNANPHVRSHSDPDSETTASSSPLTSLTLSSSTSSSTSNFTNLTAGSVGTAAAVSGSTTMPRGSATSQSGPTAATTAARSSTMPKAASNSSGTSGGSSNAGGIGHHHHHHHHAQHQPRTVITADSLLLPPGTPTGIPITYSHSQSRSNRPNGTDRTRPSRIASCISVQSVASIASTDSSLSDYPPNTPICKFCHQRAKANDPLISPCHCKGTIRYMHCRCLMKWLEKLKKRNSRHQPLACEICNYEYRWKKRFKPSREWQLPPCIGNDRQWHTVFIVCALLMVISMINLIVFGEEDGSHSGGRHGHHSHNNYGSIRFAHAAHGGGGSGNQLPHGGGPGGATSGDAYEVKNPASHLAVKDIFGSHHPEPARKEGDSKEDDGTAEGGASGISSTSGGLLFPFFNPNTDPNGGSGGHHNLTLTALHFNNMTDLWRNLSQYIPPKLLERLSTSLPKAGGLRNGTLNGLPIVVDSRSKAAGDDGSSSESLSSIFESRLGKITPPSRENAADHFLYHPHRPHKSHRKNLPTKPSEVILVISGCLFFITFFLGTFAQIKSEVSFYTMIVRFVHYNQQWIIEEYDPDGGRVVQSSAEVSSGESTGFEGVATAATNESNDASNSTITKEVTTTGSSSLPPPPPSSADHSRQVAVQIECTSATNSNSSEIAVVALPSATPTATSVVLATHTPLHSRNQVIDL